jgi:hypothetical protein
VGSNPTSTALTCDDATLHGPAARRREGTGLSFVLPAGMISEAVVVVLDQVRPTEQRVVVAAGSCHSPGSAAGEERAGIALAGAVALLHKRRSAGKWNVGVFPGIGDDANSGHGWWPDLTLLRLCGPRERRSLASGEPLSWAYIHDRPQPARSPHAMTHAAAHATTHMNLHRQPLTALAAMQRSA